MAPAVSTRHAALLAGGAVLGLYQAGGAFAPSLQRTPTRSPAEGRGLRGAAGAAPEGPAPSGAAAALACGAASVTLAASAARRSKQGAQVAPAARRALEGELGVQASTMKAWAVTKYGDASALLTAMDVEKPQPGAGEVLVKNMAIATNPIDYKVVAGALAPGEEAPPQRLIVGWDSAGVVEAVGEGVKGFQAGDKVWFAGDITKDGCYSQYTKIDSRIISKMPSTLSFEDAAALPLTFQTAWEGMVELMGVQKGKSIFVLNGAGGLGSMVIQVAKHLGLTVIASASRAETIEFCKQMGADHVVNHRNEDLGAELKHVGFDCVDYIYNAHENDRLGELFKLLVCDGRLVVTFGPTQEQMAKVDWTTAWLKRQTLCFQMMFARSMFNTEPAMVGGVMATLAKLVDQGSIKTTVTKKYGNMEEINDATKFQMSGKAIGKICLTMTH